MARFAPIWRVTRLRNNKWTVYRNGRVFHRCQSSDEAFDVFIWFATH